MNQPVEPATPLVAIVDDEQDIGTYLRLVLEDHGFRVVTISDAAVAAEELDAANPDLIMLDLLMPKRTGVKVYSEIVANPRLAGVPIVIMSGLTSREDLPAILADSGNLPSPACFLEKPIAVDQLLTAVESHLLQAQGRRS